MIGSKHSFHCIGCHANKRYRLMKHKQKNFSLQFTLRLIKLFRGHPVKKIRARHWSAIKDYALVSVIRTKHSNEILASFYGWVKEIALICLLNQGVRFSDDDQVERNPKVSILLYLYYIIYVSILSAMLERNLKRNSHINIFFALKSTRFHLNSTSAP